MKNSWIGAVAALATAALVLSACSGAKPESDSSEVTLTFATWQWQEPGRGEKIWEAVSEYQKAHPGVTIEKQQITRADYEKTLSTQIGAGGGPDVMILPDPFYYTLADADVLEPLGDDLSASSRKELRSKNANYETDGEQYAYVWGIAPYALFWNKKIIEQAGVTPPTTFDELLAAAKQVTETTGKTGFVVRHQMNEATAWWEDFANWPYGFGGEWSDGEKLTIDSPENIAAVTALKEMYDSGAFGTGDDASTYRSKFGAGEVGFVLDNATVVATTIADNDVVTSDDIGSSVLPFPGGSSAAGGTVVAVNSNTVQADAAREFVAWLMESEMQAKLADVMFPASVGSETLASQEILDANPWVLPFYEQLNDSKSTLITGFEVMTPELSTIVLTQVQNVLTSGLSPKEALETAQKQAVEKVGK